MSNTLSGDTPNLEAILTTFKAEGLDAIQATIKLKSEAAPPAVAAPATAGIYQLAKPGELAIALVAVYANAGMTPLELAQSLKIYFGNANDVALGVKLGYPDLTSTAIGKLLLDPSIYPALTRVDMQAALLFAGFNQQDVNAALNALYPIQVNVTVQANIAWQDTGVTVSAGTGISVTYVSGLWTANPYTGFVTSVGNPSYIAKPGYTLQGAYEGALIGRVGENLFLIGAGATVPAGLSGPLQLCINDDLNGIYGPGLRDNTGSVNMLIASVV